MWAAPRTEQWTVWVGYWPLIKFIYDGKQHRISTQTKHKRTQPAHSQPERLKWCVIKNELLRFATPQRSHSGLEASSGTLVRPPLNHPACGHVINARKDSEDYEKIKPNEPSADGREQELDWISLNGQGKGIASREKGHTG